MIGLVSAWRLAQQGVLVTVLDSGQLGQASTAAAGMLAPLAEAHSPGPSVELGLSSLHLYPEFVAELAEETDRALALCGPGLLRVARSEEEEERLCAAFAWQKSAGPPLEWLDGAAARSLEPNLASTVRAAILSPQEKHLPPRLLHAALQDACTRRNITFRPEAVLEFDVNGSAVTGVRTTSGTVPCSNVVIAGGAWSADLCANLGIVCPVFPVCGQILALTPPLPFPIRHTLYAPQGYLVPRPDGTVVAGATEEYNEFDARTTADGIKGLRQMAEGLAPELRRAEQHSAWAGLRPVSAGHSAAAGPRARVGECLSGDGTRAQRHYADASHRETHSGVPNGWFQPSHRV